MTVLPEAEDDDDDDNEVDNVSPSMMFGERHERHEDCQDIEYDQQMQRSLKNYGQLHGYDKNHECNCKA